MPAIYPVSMNNVSTNSLQYDYKKNNKVRNDVNKDSFTQKAKNVLIATGAGAFGGVIVMPDLASDFLNMKLFLKSTGIGALLGFLVGLACFCGKDSKEN